MKQVAAVVGGSMGGMAVLEWSYFGKDFVRAIAPIATCSRHSAWGISWGEAQRQSIYCDPKYEDGYYPFEDPPVGGLGAARMSALLTYRSRDSFQSRFGRNVPDPSKKQTVAGSPKSESQQEVNENWRIHNEGHRNPVPVSSHRSSTPSTPITPSQAEPTITDPQFSGDKPVALGSPLTTTKPGRKPTTYFSAQSYLRYQGQKFVKRFDANAYLCLTRKLDTHDVSRGRVAEANPTEAIAEPAQADAIMPALALIEQPALVLGIKSDGLFTFAEQQEIADGIPDSRLRQIESPEGHDAFLLQFEQVNKHLLEFFSEVLPDIMSKQVVDSEEVLGENGFKVQKESQFGEAEVDDITAW